MGYDYDAVIIGGGQSGLSAAGVAAKIGAKTAVIECGRLGGRRTGPGSLPVQSLLRTAAIAHTAASRSHSAVECDVLKIDFERLIGEVERVRDAVDREEDAAQLLEEAGVDVIRGSGRLVDEHTVAVENGHEHRVSARFIFLATGASEKKPEVAGLAEEHFKTAETILHLREMPQSMSIIGTGLLACEIAQAFCRLGVVVSVIGPGGGILDVADDELASMLKERLEDEGVKFVLGAEVRQGVSTGEAATLEVEQGGAVKTISSDLLLRATGYEANVSNLGLEAAGVAFTRDGVRTNRRGRTTVRNIYAIGDVTGNNVGFQGTNQSARIAVMNALLKAPLRFNPALVRWSISTDPQLGHVGSTEEDLRELGTNYSVHRFPYLDHEKILANAAAGGWIKVLVRSSTGRILGASLLGPDVVSQIPLLSLSVQNGVTLKQFMNTVLPQFGHTAGSATALREGGGDTFAASDRLSQLVASLWP